MQPPEATDVEVHRFFRAARERVFDAWTPPELIKQWNTRAGVAATIAEVDLRVGGRYRLDLCGPDGRVHRVEGVYRVVESPARLSYTWCSDTDSAGHESLVTVEFRDCNGGTEVSVRHERLSTPATQGRHANGWHACLLQLEQLLMENEWSTT